MGAPPVAFENHKLINPFTAAVGTTHQPRKREMLRSGTVRDFKFAHTAVAEIVVKSLESHSEVDEVEETFLC